MKLPIVAIVGCLVLGVLVAPIAGLGLAAILGIGYACTRDL